MVILVEQNHTQEPTIFSLIDYASRDTGTSKLLILGTINYSFIACRNFYLKAVLNI